MGFKLLGKGSRVPKGWEPLIYTYSNDTFLNNNTAKYIDIESNTSEKVRPFLNKTTKY